MKFTYNWLKDFVKIKIPPKVLAEKLTMAGLEVTSLEEKDGDFVFEVEVTSNRPDWLSIIGIAREAAAITNAECRLQNVDCRKSPIPKNLQSKIYNLQSFKIQIQDKKSCALYTGCLIEGVKVAPSLLWMQKRLSAAGLRPVNNIVDITNYVLMETGQPLHAFDYDKLTDKTIVVRRAKDNEEITTIDGAKKQLDSSILVIADSKKAVAIAGIMGGKDTEVCAETKNILLESAYFDPISIRRAARKLGLSSDSSYRFERSVDLMGVRKASERAADLICKLANAEKKDFVSIPAHIKLPAKKISVDTARVSKLLAENISPAKMKIMLSHLGFSVKLAGKTKLLISIPTFRQDVKEEADIIEEISRCIGYDNIAAALPAVRVRDIKIDNYAFVNKVRDILIKLGLNEIVTLSLINKDILTKTNFSLDKAIFVKNPLSNDQEVLRPSLLPSMLNCVSTNFNRNIKDLSLFEISRVFSSLEEPIEISIALTGVRPFSWQEKDRRELNFFDLKGIVEQFLLQLGLKSYAFVPSQQPYFSAQQSADIEVEKNIVGTIGKINQEVLDRLDIPKKDIFVTEICLNKLLPFINLSHKYTPLNKFPKILRNMSIAVSRQIALQDIKDRIYKNAPEVLSDVQLVDEYKGGQIEKGLHGLTFLLVYQSRERTLTDEEVNNIHSKICGALSKQLNAKMR